MKNRLFPVAAMLTAALLAVQTPARAAAITGNGQIDFTDHTVWNFANNAATSASVVLFDNVRVTLTATGGNLTSNAGDVTGWSGTGTGACSAPYATTLVCDGDGIGVSDDEITGNQAQVLTVSFTDALSNAPLVVWLTRIEVLDLFESGTADPAGEIGLYGDSGLLGWTQILPKSGMANGGTGYQSVSVDPALAITSIQFMGQADPLSDFSLARLTLSTSVSEPSALAIFGIALLALGTVRRRRTASAS